MTTVDALANGALQERRRRAAMGHLGGDLVMLPALLALLVVFGALGVPQWTMRSFENVVVQNSSIAIAAIGFTFVLIAAGIDLSVGATVSTCAVVATAVMKVTSSGGTGVLAAVLVGVAVGALLGAVINGFGLIPFVATLAGLYVVSGVALLVTKGATVAPVPSAITTAVFSRIGGVPALVWLVVVLFVMAEVALRCTAWGRSVLLVGANQRTSRISGLRVKTISWSTYAVNGGFAGLAGAVMAMRLGGATASAGTDLLFSVVGAVIIGGTSMFGGRGSLIRTAIGFLFIGYLVNGLQVLGMASWDQQIAKGAVIVVAVLVDLVMFRRSGRR